MKGFFKSHPELLILLIVVIAVDGFIVWMWLDDLAATAVSKQAHEKLVNDAKQINNSQWRVNAENASSAEKELAKWESSFADILKKEQQKYTFDIDYKKGVDQPATARRIFKSKIDKISQELLKDKDKTTDKLSFFTYSYENTMMTMKGDEIESVFIILKGLEELIQNCIKADIISLDQVQRPSELAFEEDKSISTKRYTYLLTVSATSDSLKKLINEISKDENYFFEINSIKITAEDQITAGTSDLVPKVSRVGKSQANANQPKRGIRDLEANFENLVTGNTKVENPDEPVIYKDSISPFSQAINKVEISVDWIQFIKEK